MTSSGAIAAFFDLDGTLLPAPSLEWRFASYLDQSGLFNLPGWIASAVKNIFRDPLAAVFRNKGYLAGLPETLAEDWVRSLERDHGHRRFFSQTSGQWERSPYFAAGLRRLAWHASEGHRVFLVSGTLAPLARAIARDLSRTLECMAPARAGRLATPSLEICATELELLDGRWTGRLAGPQIAGEAKAQSLRTAARDGIMLAESYAYGNSLADLPMLEAVGHPVAVNPSRRLVRLAQRRGWEVVRGGENSNAIEILPARIPVTKGAQ